MRPGLLLGAASSGRKRSPAAGADDPDFASVVLLANWNGTNGGTDAIDVSNSAKNISYIGDAVLSNVQTLHYPTALSLQGSSGRCQLADSDDWFPEGPYTAEVRYRTPSTVSNGFLFGQWRGGPNLRNWIFNVSGGNMRITVSTSGGGTAFSLVTPIVADTDYEFAFDIDAVDGTLRFYKDGAVVGTQNLTGGQFRNIGRSLIIGATDQGGNDIEGFVYECRITKGVQRYGGAYTPTTEAWPTQ